MTHYEERASTETWGDRRVDFTEVGHRNARASLHEHFSALVEWKETDVSFWKDFAGELHSASTHTIVVADLARLVRKYRSYDNHVWIKSVRRLQPYFVALVRTKADERCAFVVDELVRHSDLRISVCRGTNRRDVTDCLNGALRAIHPDTILDVRYVADSDAFWVYFSDGTAGNVTWKMLDLDSIRESLIPDTVVVGAHGTSIELLTADGDIFDIDADSVKATLDQEHNDLILQEGVRSNEIVGSRIRQRRKKAGLSQTQLGERIGIDQALLSKLERGKHQPRIDTLRRIAEGLSVSVTELVSDEGAV